jgi:hypothetical protein
MRGLAENNDIKSRDECEDCQTSKSYKKITNKLKTGTFDVAISETRTPKNTN